MRASTSASQASGSMSLSWAVIISVVIAAARSAPRSEPANSHDLRPNANPRSARSAALFARFLADGRICLTNNAAERALRGFALGRKSWLFAGSERGADRAAAMTTLIMTAKLNDIDPLAWLADVLARIADLPQSQLAVLLPWNWQRPASYPAAAQAA